MDSRFAMIGKSGNMFLTLRPLLYTVGGNSMAATGVSSLGISSIFHRQWYPARLRHNVVRSRSKGRLIVETMMNECPPPPPAGPARWFSPLESAGQAPNSPLLLYLPGIDGTGFGLTKHHKRLGKMFDVWCLHLPFTNRTPAEELVKLVEETVRSEYSDSPNRPIYIVGESLGACLALEVAARNPDIDLVLILANPATSFNNTMLQPLTTLFDVLANNQLPVDIDHLISFVTGDPLKTSLDMMLKSFSLNQMVGEQSQILGSALPKGTLLWKLKTLKAASASANSHLHAVKAQTLILFSGKDKFLPSEEESKRLCCTIQTCESRGLKNSGHFLFLEDGVDLVTIIKGVSFYRRGKHHDYITDYLPPTSSEIQLVQDAHRLMDLMTSPVMFSTLEDGKVVKGLAGIPLEGPVLYVGNHMLPGADVMPILCGFFLEKKFVMRLLGHPMMFRPLRKGSWLNMVASYDWLRILGLIPVSPNSLHKLLSSKAHVLLYPGGARESLHRKGEEYKLFWPEHSEFVRMAAKFGAKIIPFGVVGEDDIGEVIFDYNDQMKIPCLKAYIEIMTNEAIKIRSGETGEVANQDFHIPIVAPKFPGRFYYYFGKPIETAGKEDELRDREKAHEVYLEVKSEIEDCLAFLKEKRKSDPYRNLVSRFLYQMMHGFNSDIPTFEL